MVPPVESFSPEERSALLAALAARDEVIAALQAQNAALVARVADLERRLGLNSGNSGKPPSSDGLTKPPRTQSLRGPSDKKSGGQPGHPGKTLKQVSAPDATIDHYPTRCPGCASVLTEAMDAGYSARQVFDLPEPRPLIVTEHRAHRCRCANCGTQTQASFPEQVTAPVQYGMRISAVVVYLLNFHFIPEHRLAEVMADLFDVTLSRATIGRMSADCAQRFQGFADAVRTLIVTAPLKHLDETGFRIGGKTQWLHIACTLLLTFYRVSVKRGSLLSGVTGIIVHDHWKPYYTMTGVLHALCNAHHLRELQALVEIEKEEWARKMQRLLRRACHATNLARKRGIPLDHRLIALILRCYDATVAEGIAFHQALPPLAAKTTKGGKKRGPQPRRTGHNLLLRLSTRKEDVLRFLTDPTVPFTNNQAERDGRMMKLRQKISGGFRSEDGARDFAIIRTLISTAKKQGWNVIQILNQNSDALIDRLRIA
jgi:transposase